jgi:glycosyltransferase involved in cell wall biosynthesis
MTGKMRILHVVPSYFPAVRYGGPIFAVHGLCRALAAQGHHVEVFTTSINGPDNSSVPIGVPVLLDGVHVMYFTSKVLRRLFWSPSLGRALRADIGSFSVVHLHSVFLWPTWAAAQLAKRAKVPYLISPHGMLVKELIARRSRLAKSVWIKFIEKNNLENASVIHVTSQLEAEELCRFGWRLPPLVTIPNGVDEIKQVRKCEISADVAQVAAQQPLVLFLGRISWKKGLDRLLNAVAVSKAAKLAIVGPDDENMLPQLTRAVEELQMGDRVTILPRTVLGADKDHLYASAKLFVLSSYSENFGMTVLEAMQHGVPVITTPEVGAAKIVLEAKAGFVVPGGPESLGGAIQQMIENVPLAQAMGEAGQRHVTDRYGWACIAEQMENVYTSLTRRDSITEGHRGDSIKLGY